MKSNPGSQNIKEPSSLERTVKRFIDWGFFSKDAWLLHLILPIIFIVLMVLFHPFRETFQTDTDEGINLIKAVLVMEGHQITGDIETDQPPLLSNLLAMVFRWTGQSVNVARLMVLLFSGVLLGAAGMSSQTAWNRGTGLLVYLMLILLPNYLLLSVSVMIGQPSITLAMVSLLCIFMWHRCRKWPWLVLAGLFISLSLFTKIFTAILLPVFGVGLLVAEWTILQDNTKKTLQKRWIQILKPAFIFSLSVIGISAILAVTLLELENVMILFLPHLTYRSLTSVTGSITADLKSAALPIILATIGLGFSIVKRKWLALYPAAWAIIAYLSLLNHNPIWWHHQMLVTIPAALLSAYGVFSITKGFWELNQVHNLWHKALIFGGLFNHWGHVERAHQGYRVGA